MVIVASTTFNNFSAMSWLLVFWWRKPEYPEKTLDLPQLYNIMSY